MTVECPYCKKAVEIDMETAVDPGQPCKCGAGNFVARIDFVDRTEDAND